MRITISSPDGLGDFVLRMPLFEALCDAGHDLQIFMRPPALELAAAVLPAARIEKISEDPYARLVRFRRNPFDLDVKKIATFAPDLFVIALFQHSFFDEICLSKLPKRLRVAGFRSADAFWSTQANIAPQELANRFDTWVEVKTDIPELEKNRLLACAILGSGVPSRPARISPPPTAINDARSTLRQYNIGENEYWVVCAGSRPGLEIKDWGEANWIAALSQIASETQAPFLFLGNEAEAPSIERIRSGLPKEFSHFNLAKSPPSYSGHLGNYCSLGRLSSDAIRVPCTWRPPARGRFSRCPAAGFGAAFSLRQTVPLLSRGRCLARDALAIAICPNHSVFDALPCSNSSTGGNSSKARRCSATRIVEVPMDARTAPGDRRVGASPLPETRARGAATGLRIRPRSQPARQCRPWHACAGAPKSTGESLEASVAKLRLGLKEHMTIRRFRRLTQMLL